MRWRYRVAYVLNGAADGLSALAWRVEKPYLDGVLARRFGDPATARVDWPVVCGWIVAGLLTAGFWFAVVYTIRVVS